MNKKVCSCCNCLEIIVSKKNGFPVCHKCYYKNYSAPLKKCCVCNEEKKIYKNDKNGPLCQSCYNPPKKKCSNCGEIDQIYGDHLCKKCYKYPKGICSICNKFMRISVKNDSGIICSSCRHIQRYNNDYNYRTKCILRERIRSSFKSYSIKGKVKSSKKYGINYQAIIDHLGPCPGEREDYHIDHIIPLSVFNFNDDKHIKLAFSPENHQWLKKKDNLIKSAKYNKEEFDNYINKGR